MPDFKVMFVFLILDSEKLLFGTDEGLFALDLTAKQDCNYFPHISIHFLTWLAEF